MFIIKNGAIVDGTGKPSFKGDILIKGDTISAIGNFSSAHDHTTIDARGARVVPGFIDIHTASDHYLTLFTHPLQEDFITQGVTTIIGGQCGASLAPLLYGSLESIRKWADTNAVNVDWHTVDEFLSTLKTKGLGVNFGTFIGHATIRRALVGVANRDLTIREMDVLKHVVDEGMRQGAFGLSTGLGYASSKQVPYGEIKELLQIVKKTKGVYATHLRHERDHLLEAVDEAITIAREIGVKTIISHYRPLIGFEQLFSDGMSNIEAAAKEVPIWFDGYPSDMSLVPLYTLLPDWARVGRMEQMVHTITNKTLHERIVHDLPRVAGDDIRIVQAPHAPYLNGKTIGSFSQNQGVSIAEGLVRLMRMTKLRAVVLYKNGNLDLSIQSLRSSRALIASNSPSFSDNIHLVSDRTTGVFPRFLSLMEYLRYMSFEMAVKRITSTPAELLGISDRGILAEGMKADITILRDAKVTDVFVNGTPALTEGRSMGRRNGRILRKRI